jgi:hypothetical protein
MSIYCAVRVASGARQRFMRGNAWGTYYAVAARIEQTC